MISELLSLKIAYFIYVCIKCELFHIEFTTAFECTLSTQLNESTYYQISSKSKILIFFLRFFFF